MKVEVVGTCSNYE